MEGRGYPFLKCDVVVVGGGPAGAATAIACCRSGLRVVVLEALEFPRPRPGESLPPAVEPLLKHWGVGSVLEDDSWARYEGIWTSWGGGLEFKKLGSDYRGQWRGWHMPRDAFDLRLLEEACRLGAVLKQPSRALSVVRSEDGRVAGVKTTEGLIEAGFVVDASGGRHWLARKLGLNVRRESPSLVTRYGYARSRGLMECQDPKLETDEYGWTWTAPIGGGRLAWARMHFDGSPVGSEWCPELLGSEFMDKDDSHSADTTWRRVEGCAGPGYFCVGDAAVVVDPLSSHGVLRALMSGFMAGSSIASVRGFIDEKSFIFEYDSWVKSWFDRDCSELKDLYRKLPNPPSWVV